MVKMVKWSRIIAEKFGIIFKVCARTDKQEEEVSQMWTGEDKGKGGRGVINH